VRRWTFLSTYDGADQLITTAIDAHVQGEQRKDGEGPAAVLTLRANSTLMARKISNGSRAGSGNKQ
jgi:hypothetical protein